MATVVPVQRVIDYGNLFSVCLWKVHEKSPGIDLEMNIAFAVFFVLVLVDCKID